MHRLGSTALSTGGASCMPVLFVRGMRPAVIVDKPTATNDERKRAKAQVAEAEREVDLLLNRTQQPTESDFYPYRYLAAEGFLPGYNFPRLPLRALLEAEITTMDALIPRAVSRSKPSCTANRRYLLTVIGSHSSSVAILRHGSRIGPLTLF
jgi:hypothetical protein